MANQYTKLFINNQPIDLNKSEALPLNITKRVNSIDGDVKGDYSRASITVPATKNNISILGRTRMFLNFRIEGDGAPDFHGTAQAKRIKTYSQGYGAIEENYEINLISNNASWFVRLSSVMLSDLTDLIVNFSEPEILAGLVSNPSVIDYCFVPIKWKEWANYTGTPPNLQYNPSYYEMTPGLFYKPFIIAAFNSIGYTVQSNFMNLDMFSKLALDVPIPTKMPASYNDKYLSTTVSISAPILLIPIYPTQVLIFDVIDVAAPSNPLAYDTVTGLYTCPLNGFYEIEIAFTFQQPAPAPTTIFITQLQKNAAFLNPNVGLAFTGSPTQPYPTGIIKVSTVLQLVAGDTINTVIGYNGTSNATMDSATMTITGEATFQQGMPIDFKYLLEKFKFNDMFLGFKAMYNWGIETNDVTKIVTIEPLDGYLDKDRIAGTSIRKEGFYKTTIVKDYSQLIDYNKKGEIELQLTNGIFDFKYKSDSDETIEFVEGVNDLEIYQAKFSMSDGADVSKVKTIEVPFFAKTIHVSDILSRYPNTNTVPQFLLIYPQNYILDPTATAANYDQSPRVFYFAGQRVGFEEKDGQMQFFENIGVPALVPAAFMVNYNDNTGLDPNLGFDNKIINGVESLGLVHNYYLQKLARDDKGELTSNYVKFNSIDNFNFSFRVKGLINSQRYVIQEIRAYNPITDLPSQFFFYLDVFPDSDDVNNITNSPLLGIVNLLAN